MSKTIFTYMSDEVLESLTWQEDIDTPTWCKENICLTPEASPSMPGWISFDKTPWIEEILSDWDKEHVSEYNILASTQVGKTTIQFCCLAKEFDTQMGQMLFMIPTDDGVSDYVATKFDPFIVESIASIKKKIVFKKDEDKKRLKGALKEAPGVKAYILGNTAPNRRSKSVTRVFIDEAALFGSGHIDEILGRMKFSETINTTKAMIVSSLKYVGDEMEVQYDNSYCKKELQIECPSCKNHFYPGSKNFKYLMLSEYKKDNELEQVENLNDYKRIAKKTGRVECECGEKIYTKDIHEIVKKRKVNLIIVEGTEEDTIYGYKLNALASGLTKYETIVEKLIKAEGDEEKLSTIYQDYFNEIYQGKTNKIQHSEILLLESEYDEFVIPDDTIGLYMGVDSQKGYYWVTIMAIEYNIKPHLVWAGRVDDEATIEDLMDRDYFYSDGMRYNKGIRRAYHDWQGYKTPQSEIVENENTGEVIEELVLDMPQRVKQFAYKMAQKYGANADGEERYYAVRGEQFLANDDIFKYATTTFEIEGFKEKRKLKTLKVNTTATKSMFMSMVRRSIAKEKSESMEDEAYHYEERLHFINKTLVQRLRKKEENGKVENIDYHRQITSETYDYHKNKQGRPAPYKFWKGKRDNHYLDTNGYIMIAIIQDNLETAKKPNRKENKLKDIKKIFF